ncbi:unnamed protein product [Cuscuta campestris]|uniref:Uncharacterized protein n=2 Tax=Cuscuta sect. Cleistogrammica TaxID=1824901 RepID=A0A484KXE9_9ASTE|nr:hypothetical protein DM860_006770 [Cuscuta australis]VFQ69375.1 unnamed protein product [Cuscuta campestris]
MATSFQCFSATPTILAASASHDRTKSNPNHQKLAAHSPSWWTPLFGWASDPDYIQQCSNGRPETRRVPAQPEKDRVGGHRFRPGCFTEEKAKELRKMTVETSTFHDVMYHSAIASRKAFDVAGRRRN